jgi:hypothetical protein
MADTGITKVWAFFKPSFVDRPNAEHGSGLTAFKKEWDAMDSEAKEQIRAGIQSGTLNY